MVTTAKELLLLPLSEQRKESNYVSVSDDELINFISEITSEEIKEIAATVISKRNAISDKARNESVKFLKQTSANNTVDLHTAPKVTFPLLTFCIVTFIILAICSGIGVLCYVVSYFSLSAEYDPDAHLALLKALYCLISMLVSFVIIGIMDWLKRIGSHFLKYTY